MSLETPDPKRRILDIANEYPGPILVRSGPGTGKTHLLGLRIKFLVEQMQVVPGEITVITFTDEAMRNMRQRISDQEKQDVFLPKDKQPKQIRTMHSLGMTIIRENAELLGLRSPIKLITGDRFWVSSSRIEKTSDRELMFRDAAFSLNIENPTVVARQAGNCKGLGKCVVEDKDECHICTKYGELLNFCGAIDYDDQVMRSCQLLSNNPEILSKWQNQAKYLLVDEYQDINYAQFCLIRLLTRENPAGVFVVGDEDQSIYGFRGGSPEFIKNFLEDFPGGKEMTLTHNWRCSSEIMNQALSVVEKYSPRIESRLALTFERSSPGLVKTHSTPTEEGEAEIVARMIADQLPAHEVLVLVPRLSVADKLSDKMQQRRISFDCSVDISEYGISTLATIGDWLRDPNDNIKARVCAELIAESDQKLMPSRLCRTKGKKELRRAAMENLASLWTKVESDKCSYYRALESAQSGNEFLAKVSERMASFLEFQAKPPFVLAEAILRLTPPWRKSDEMIHEFTEVVSALDSRRQVLGGSVRVLSFRKAKGLEADIVYILGLEDDLFPGKVVQEKSANQEESARLLYVSMTRAKDELHLFRTRKKRSGDITFGGEKYDPQRCHFLDAMGLSETYHSSQKQ